MGLLITIAGQNVSIYAQEMTIDIDDTLGQGAGVGGGASGRATTCQFTVAGLGPAASAVGAGSVISSPTLVRQGELIITDATGTTVFGGYVTDLEDVTEYTVPYVLVGAHDYWQALARVTVNTVYDGQSDNFIVKDLLTNYAPWIDQSLIGSTVYYTFGPLNFRNKTLQACLQKIADTSGCSIWIDPTKKAHYTPPTGAANAPFSLTTSSPDSISTFPFAITKYTQDDNSIINRVTFYGGKNLSQDFTQDLSIQANGSNNLFTFIYYPHKSSDGLFHVGKNGHDLIAGFDGSAGATNTLIQDGGTAQVLINIDNHTIKFDASVIPASADHPYAKYRYEIPLTITVTDEASRTYFGNYYDGTIADTSVFDSQTAVKRCRTLLLEQSFGLTHIELSCYQPGIQAGMLLRIDHYQRNLHNTYIVQEVHIVPLGNGHFRYDITCGAWNWNLVDMLMQTAQLATSQDDTTDETNTPVTVEQDLQTVTIAETWTSTARNNGGYYPRLTAVGDGHDAYPGLASV